MPGLALRDQGVLELPMAVETAPDERTQRLHPLATEVFDIQRRE